MDLGAEDTRYDLFEKVYICLYDDEGACRFFDVEEPPPRNGRPPDSQTLSFAEFVDAVHAEVERRNRFAPTWSEPDESNPRTASPTTASERGDTRPATTASRRPRATLATRAHPRLPLPK